MNRFRERNVSEIGKKRFPAAHLCGLLILFSPFPGLLCAQENLPSIDLREKRTEFSRTGSQLDAFFDSLQARILYSFAKAQEHFSLIFETAKKEGGEKSEEWVRETGEKAMKKLQEETGKLVRENVNRKTEELFSNSSSPNRKPPEKEGKKESANTDDGPPPLPRLPEIP